MKKYLLILTLISVVILASGCINNGNQTSGNAGNQTKTFSGDDITFQYPASWNTIASQARDSVIAVGDPSTADGNGQTRVNVVVQRIAQPQNETFSQYYTDTYSQFAAQNLSFVPISDGTITVNGMNANENTYKINSGELKQQRAIWIQKNGRIYIILCSAPVSDYNGQQASFDTIVNSFKIS